MELRMSSSSRQRLTINEKLALLDEFEKLEFGQRAEWCRQRKLAPSMVTRWRKARREGLMGPSDKKESPLALMRAERIEYERQKQRIADLEARLAQSESAVEILGKASALLESLTKGAQADQDRLDLEQERADLPAWGQRFEK